MPIRLLADDLVVLAHEPTTGRPLQSQTRLSCAVAGSVLAELLLTGRITLDGHTVRPTGTGSAGEPELDALAEIVATSAKTRRAAAWVRTLRPNKHAGRLVTRAVRLGLAQHEEHRTLLLFTRHHYIPAHPGEREVLVRTLHDVLVRSRTGDARTMALLRLVTAMGLDRPLFPDLPRRDRRELVRELLDGDEIGQAVRRVIQEIESSAAGASF
jgi:hypothetical protein